MIKKLNILNDILNQFNDEHRIQSGNEKIVSYFVDNVTNDNYNCYLNKNKKECKYIKCVDMSKKLSFEYQLHLSLFHEIGELKHKNMISLIDKNSNDNIK